MYNIEMFTNNNSVNFEGSQAQLESVLTAYNHINDDAFPVLVYEYEGSAVAWYDIENEWGFVS